jgi:hypothetical protein
MRILKVRACAAAAMTLIFQVSPSIADQKNTRNLDAVAKSACFKDGDVITVQGTAASDSLELADGSRKSVWLFTPYRPICITESQDGIAEPKAHSVDMLQVVGKPPPPTAVPIELKGKLSTRNITQYYAVSTAIAVTSGRRLAASGSYPRVASGSATAQGDENAQGKILTPDVTTALTARADSGNGDATVSPHEKERMFDALAMQVRSCIRSNIVSAYQAGVYGRVQAIAYFKAVCGSAYLQAWEHDRPGMLGQLAFEILVIQETAPDEWQRAVDKFSHAVEHDN